MVAEHADRLRVFADLIVRVGVNLQAGQGLLLTDPFELQGVARSSHALVEAIRSAARGAGGGVVDVIWGDESRLLAAARCWPDDDFEHLLAVNAVRMQRQIREGGALLFLQGSQPRLLDGVAASKASALRMHCWQHYGPVAARLVAGATNWSVVPAPSVDWARIVMGGNRQEVEPGRSLECLWDVVFKACHVDADDPLAAWRGHLDRLERWRSDLQRRHARALRFSGDGTDLEVRLLPGHRWCTAALRSENGVAHVANMPTEEVFTAPDRKSAEGRVRVARPVAYAGSVIDGIELEFHRGAVVKARARTGEDLLRRLLQADAGASRLGEVAMVASGDAVLAREGRFFYHPLLDENALPHIALGDGYPFSASDATEPALNHSMIHVDLPIEAAVALGT